MRTRGGPAKRCRSHTHQIGGTLMAGLGGRAGIVRWAGLAGLTAIPVAGIVAAGRHSENGGGTARMPLQDDRSRIAHLYRRAGFGASPTELDAAVGRGFDATLDRLLNPPDNH